MIEPNSQPLSGLIDRSVGLIVGATYPFRAIGVFFNYPHLRGFIIVPIFVNIFLGIVLYLGLLFPGLQAIEGITVNLSQFLEIWINSLPQWLQFLTVFSVILGGFLKFILVLVLFLFIGFLLLQFGVIFGSPWYGQLSEQLELLKLGEAAILPSSHPMNIAQDIWRAILFELKKLLLQLSIGLPLFLLNFIPGFGTLLFTVAGILLAATITGLDFLDASLERRRLRFRDKLGLLYRTFPASASFAIVCLVLVTLPFINLLAIPLCVAAGTLFFCDRISPKYFSTSQGIGNRE